MSSELGISRCPLSKVIKKDLGLSSYKLRKVHFLSDKIKQKRSVRSKGLVQRFTICGLENVPSSDEKLFTIEQAYNHQNNRILSTSSSTTPEELKYVKRTQKPASVMVRAGISEQAEPRSYLCHQGLR